METLTLQTKVLARISILAKSQSVTAPTMVPKAPFSDGYKGLDEVVTETVGRYTNLADSCDDHLFSHRRFYFVYSKFCFLILQKHDLKSFFKTTWLYINNQAVFCFYFAVFYYIRL